MAKLTTLERAKRFAKRITHWRGGKSQPLRPWDWDEWDIESAMCERAVYRALLKQEIKGALTNYDRKPSQYWAAYQDALEEALELHDAVHGRKTDD